MGDGRLADFQLSEDVGIAHFEHEGGEAIDLVVEGVDEVGQIVLGFRLFLVLDEFLHVLHVFQRLLLQHALLVLSHREVGEGELDQLRPIEDMSQIMQPHTLANETMEAITEGGQPIL